MEEDSIQHLFVEGIIRKVIDESLYEGITTSQLRRLRSSGFRTRIRSLVTSSTGTWMKAGGEIDDPAFEIIADETALEIRELLENADYRKPVDFSNKERKPRRKSKIMSLYEVDESNSLIELTRYLRDR